MDSFNERLLNPYSPLFDAYPAFFSYAALSGFFFSITYNQKSLCDNKLVFWFGGWRNPGETPAGQRGRRCGQRPTESRERLQGEREGGPDPRGSAGNDGLRRARKNSSSRRWAPRTKRQMTAGVRCSRGERGKVPWSRRDRKAEPQAQGCALQGSLTRPRLAEPVRSLQSRVSPPLGMTSGVSLLDVHLGELNQYRPVTNSIGVSFSFLTMLSYFNLYLSF